MVEPSSPIQVDPSGPSRNAALLRLVLRSTGRLVVWICAHYALEWLFFATKPSIVSAASTPARLLLLFATPLPALLLFAPLQIVVSAADGLRRRARHFWFAAVLPASAASVLAIIAIDNFTNTVFGFGIIDAYHHRRFYVAFIAAIAGLLLYREARLLAERTSSRHALLAAVLLATCAAGASALVARQAPPPSAPRPLAARIKPPRTPNVLLIGIDGAVAEHISAYGYHRKTTPVLDELAARGYLFENAFTNASRTYGSLISINTGKLPSVTHTIFPPTYLTGRDTREHLPGILRNAGYTSAQIGMRHYSDAEEWNLDDGYDLINGRTARAEALVSDRSELRERLDRHRAAVHDRVHERYLQLAGIRKMEDEFAFLTKGERDPAFSDKLRVRLAEDFIQARREPWLMHLHFSDTHCCGEYGVPKVAWPDGRKVEQDDLFDDVLRHTDRNLGRLVELLARTGQLDRTMIIVYSDHTRSWTTIGRLPLVIVPPGGIAPRRIKPNVQLVDLAPTILDQLGLPKPAWMNGQSLLRPELLDPMRPIIALNQITVFKTSGPGTSVVVRAGPPYYGTSTATVIICDRALELHLRRKEVWVREIRGHTAPCGMPPLGQDARSLLARHLRANGYPADDTTPWREVFKPLVVR